MPICYEPHPAQLSVGFLPGYGTIPPRNTLPFQFLLVTPAGWVNRGQQDVIGYLQEENRVLREHLGSRRLHFTDAQRRRLANKAKALGRQTLSGIGPVVTPDTLLRWYRTLVARNLTDVYDGFLTGSRYLIHDRDPLFTEVFRAILKDGGVLKYYCRRAA